MTGLELFLFYTFLYVFRNNKKNCGLVYCLGLIYIKNSGDGNCNENYALGYVFPHGVTYHKYKGHCGVIIKKK